MAYSIGILIMFLENPFLKTHLYFLKLILRTQVLTLRRFLKFIDQIIEFIWNYDQERLNAGISISIRNLSTQNSRLNDITKLWTAQLIGFMRNYGNKLINSKASW